MLDYPTTLRKSATQAKDLAIEEFGLADVALVGGDILSDYPYWNRSCALPKNNFLDIKEKMHSCISESVKDCKVIYVTGNNDMMLGDIRTEENEPYISVPLFATTFAILLPREIFVFDNLRTSIIAMDFLYFQKCVVGIHQQCNMRGFLVILY